MLLRQEPLHKEKYFEVSDEEMNIFLQSMGFVPKYFWNKIFYYNINDDLYNSINIYNAVTECGVDKIG